MCDAVNDEQYSYNSLEYVCVWKGKYQIGLKSIFFLGLGFSSTFGSPRHIFPGVPTLGYESILQSGIFEKFCNKWRHIYMSCHPTSSTTLCIWSSSFVYAIVFSSSRYNHSAALHAWQAWVMTAPLFHFKLCSKSPRITMYWISLVTASADIGDHKRQHQLSLAT